MADRERLLNSMCLLVAGLATIGSSLLGCFCILGALWMRYAAIQIFPYVLLLVEVPLFALAVLLSKRFILGLWTIALVYPLALILFDRDMYTTGSFFSFIVGGGTIATLIAAAFLHYAAGPNAVPARTDSHGAEDAPRG